MAVAVTGLLLVLTGVAWGKAVKRVEVSPDTKLEIAGWLGEDNSLTGDLIVTPRGGTLPRIWIVPSALTSGSGARAIAAHDVKVEGTFESLHRGTRYVFSVKASGIDEPGTYTGNLQLRYPKQWTGPNTIDLTVTAGLRTVPTVMGTSVVIQAVDVVDCGLGPRSLWPPQAAVRRLRHWLDCRMTPLVLPERTRLTSYRATLDAPVFPKAQLEKIRVVDVDVQLFGEFSGKVLHLGPVQIVERMISAEGTTALSLMIDRTRIPPDHYTGTIHLTLADRKQRLSIPVDLKIRDGAALPILLLVLSIPMAWFVRRLGQSWLPQADAQAQVKWLEREIKKVTNKDKHDALVTKLGEARDLVTANSLTDANKKLIEVRALLEAALRAEPKPGARLAHRIEERLRLQPSGRLLATPGYIAIRQRTFELFRELLKAVRLISAPLVRAWRRLSSWLRSFVHWVGRRRPDILMKLRVPIYLLLLLTLVIVGVKVLYVDAATFGANPFTDYFTVIAWAFGSEVVSGGLSKLPWKVG